MKTIVTGGAGFIGSHLVDRLLADGGHVVAIDNFDPFYSVIQKHRNLNQASSSPNFRLIEADIRDTEAMDRAMQEHQPDVVVHLAAKAGVRPSIDNPSEYVDVNVGGTTNLLRALCRLERRPRFVFASSSSVYGDRPDAPFRESDRVDHPISPYAATKKASELIAHTFHHIHGISVTGLRFFTAFGPRNRPDLAIPKFADLIDRGLPIPMFGDGSTSRDYTYVGDLVEGIVRSIDRCEGWHLYNLGHSEPVTLKEMIEAIGEAIGKRPTIERHPMQPGDVHQTYADITLAGRDLGYVPSTPFKEGLARFVAWKRSEKR